MEHILDNAYTNRYFEYLKSKNVEVCIIIQHKVTKEISMRSSVPLIDVKSMLQKTDRDKEQSQWVSEHQRKYFPKSDGPITDVFNNKGKLIVMASKVMCFWKEVRGGQAMGIGQFPAWDNFELDMGKVQIFDPLEYLHLPNWLSSPSNMSLSPPICCLHLWTGWQKLAAVQRQQ